MTVLRVAGLSPEELEEVFWFMAVGVEVLAEVSVPVEVKEYVRLPEVVTTVVTYCWEKLVTEPWGAVVVDTGVD